MNSKVVFVLCVFVASVVTKPIVDLTTDMANAVVLDEGSNTIQDVLPKTILDGHDLVSANDAVVEEADNADTFAQADKVLLGNTDAVLSNQANGLVRTKRQIMRVGPCAVGEVRWNKLCVKEEALDQD